MVTDGEKVDRCSSTLGNSSIIDPVQDQIVPGQILAQVDVTQAFSQPGYAVTNFVGLWHSCQEATAQARVLFEVGDHGLAQIIQQVRIGLRSIVFTPESFDGGEVGFEVCGEPDDGFKHSRGFSANEPRPMNASQPA